MIQIMEAARTRRWIRFSVKGLLAVVLLVTLAIGWLASRCYIHTVLVQELWEEHIEVSADCPRVYPVSLFGVTPVTVDRVSVRNPLSDEQLALLRRLPELKWVELQYQVNDPQAYHEARSRLKNTPISPGVKKYFDASRPDVRQLRAELPEVSTIQVDLDLHGVILSTVAYSEGGASGSVSSLTKPRKKQVKR